MKLNKAYNFFFHPFAKTHSNSTTALSLLTIVALSVFTLSGYLIAFAVVNLRDRKIKPEPGNNKIVKIASPIVQPNFTANGSKVQKPSTVTVENRDKVQKPSVVPGADDAKVKRIKQKQAEQLKQFEQWGSARNWKMFTPQYSHYDWWMFPVNRASAGHGSDYAVSPKEIEALKADKEFMENYRRGVVLVVKSWGWDLEKQAAVPAGELTPAQRWTGYGVRLGKMAGSLQLFGEKDLYARLQQFCNAICLPSQNRYPLEKWVVESFSAPLH